MLFLCQVYKIVHNLDCIPFNSYFTFNTNGTRSHQLSLVCPLARINSFRYSFFINAPYLWNRIPLEVLNCKNLPLFEEVVVSPSLVIKTSLNSRSLFLLFSLLVAVRTFVWFTVS